MKKLRLLGVFCACVIPFVFSNISHAAPVVQYDYTGKMFDTNDDTHPRCTIGASGCFNNITATINLSAALGDNFAFQAITPDAWTISDGLTTITDQTAEFDLFELKVGTDGSGTIDQWIFQVARNNTLTVNELSYMQTESGGGFGTADDTRYCTVGTSSACSYTGIAFIKDDSGAWTVTTVPLPASVWLLGSGLLGLLGAARRKKAA